MAEEIDIAKINQQGFQILNSHYLELTTIWNSGLPKHENANNKKGIKSEQMENSASSAEVKSEKKNRPCQFLFADKFGNHIQAYLFINDINSRNVFFKVTDQDKKNPWFRISNLIIEDITNGDRGPWCIVQGHTKQIKLLSSTLNIKGSDYKGTAHFPLELKRLDEIDEDCPQVTMVDVIGYFTGMSEIQKSKNERFEYRIMTLQSSRQKNCFAREVALFGEFLKTTFRKNEVYAIMNLRLKEFEKSSGRNKTLQTGWNTIVTKVTRENLYVLPPNYHDQEFVQCLLPKQRKSDGRVNAIPKTETLTAPKQEETKPSQLFSSFSFKCPSESGASIFGGSTFGESNACEPKPSCSTSHQEPNGKRQSEEFIASSTNKRPAYENEDNTTFNKTDTKESSGVATEEYSDESCEGESSQDNESSSSDDEEEPNLENKRRRLRLILKNSIDYQDEPGQDYLMRSNPRGFALIINNHHYPKRKGKGKESFREGGLVDVDNLNNLFQNLKFKVTLKSDLSTKELPKVLQEFKREFDTADACIVVILSHGANDVVLMKDENCVQLHKEIIHQFDSNNFQIMAEKPKLFFIQACQDMPKGIIFEKSNMELRQKVKLENLLVVKAAISGTPARRDPKLGSAFIHCFVKAMMEHAHNTHLTDILEKVNTQLESFSNQTEESMQCEWTPHRFTKKLYFNPGLPPKA